MLFELKSNKSLAEIGKALEESAARHQFESWRCMIWKATMAKRTSTTTATA